MYRIALINPVVDRRIYYIPTGLCYLSSYVKKHIKNEVDVKILNISRPSVNRILEYSPDIVGFTSLTHTFNLVCQMAAYLKRLRPDLRLIMGGQHLSMAPWSMPKTFDYGILGEGEESFLRLVSSLLSGRDVDREHLDGVQHWNHDQLESVPRLPLIDPLDSIPFPDRENVENLEAIITYDHPGWFNTTGLRSMQLTTSRGCPYKCMFCQPSILWDKYRMHSADYIGDEIKHVHNRFGINAILIEDDLFTGSKGRAADLVENLGRKNILGQTIYYVAARASQIDREWVKLLKQLGVVKVELGIESGSDEIAKYLKRGVVSTEVNKRAISLLNEENVGVSASFMAGSPPEKMSDLRQTFEMMKWIRRNHRGNTCGISVATPLPGTGLWDHAVRTGLIDPQNFNWDRLTRGSIPSDESKMVYLNSHIPAKRLLRAIRMVNLRLSVGTPREFISAIPRRTRELIKRIRWRVASAMESDSTAGSSLSL